MNNPLNIKSDTTLSSRETSDGFFEMLLPPCEASILAKIIDPNLPYVTLIGFRCRETVTWIENNIPPMFDPVRRFESIRVKQLDLEIALSTADFLAILPSLSDRGIELVQSHRPLPKTFSFESLLPESKGRVFNQVGIELRYFLPHPHEYAIVGSPSQNVLRSIAAKLI